MFTLKFISFLFLLTVERKRLALFSLGMHLWFVRTFARNEYAIDTDGVVVVVAFVVAASIEFFSGPLSSKHV